MTRRQPLPILNGPAAVEQMVRDNTRLVTHIARQFRSPIGLEELIAEGMLGLVEGARRFDATRSVKASTYVAHWIRAYIARRVQRESGCAGSNHQRRLFWGIRRAFKSVADSEGRATAENIAAFLSIPVEIVQAFARHLVQGELRLDARAFDGDGESVGDRLLVQGRTAEDDAIDAEERGRVHEALQELSERERFVVERRFGDEPEFLEDIGKRMGGISRERVRQIEKRALEKMRRVLEAA